MTGSVAEPRPLTMLGVTFPLIRHSLWRARWMLALLVLVSLLQGIAPAAKSQLESGLIAQANDELKGRADRAERHTLDEILKLPVNKLSRKPQGADQAFPDWVALLIFGGSTVRAALAWYFVVAAAVMLLDVIAATIISRISTSMFCRLRSEAMRKALETDPHQLPAMLNASGQLTAAIHFGAHAACRTYEYVLQAGAQLFGLVTVLTLLASKSLPFAGCCLVLVAVQILISYLQAQRLTSSREEVDRHRNELVGRTDDVLSKREIVVAHEQQDSYGAKLDEYTARMAEVMRRLDVREAFYRGLSNVVLDYGKMLLLALTLVAALWMSREVIADVGDVYFLSSIYVRLFLALAGLLSRYDSLKRSEGTSKTFLTVLAAPETDMRHVEVAHDAAESTSLAIAFERVSFAYPSSTLDDPTLREFSFQAPPGEVTLILGPSGCGKTTLARLLLAFWRPSTGRILLGARDSATMNGSAVRSLMSYVAQDDYITDDTVRENLCWSDRRRYSDDELCQVLTLVEIATDFEQARGLLDKPARELSTGQKQRLSVARLMLDESPIAVLDEPISGVDVFVMKELLPHLKLALAARQRTALLITHRLVFASLSTYIVILGREETAGGAPVTVVREQGFKRDLLADPDSLLNQLYATVRSGFGDGQNSILDL